MLTPVNTQDSGAVAAHAFDTFRRLYPGANPRMMSPVFEHVDALFCGRHPDYRAIDLKYHDYEHTLQVTVCLVQLLEGWQLAGAAPAFTSRQFEIAVATALLHDSGYLRLRSDRAGTGAKFTHSHVLRSCAYLASYLPSVGATGPEISGALGAINCTGPAVQISRLHFDNDGQRIIGCVVATADYLSQMADARYPDKLGILFREFQESDDFRGVPAEKRLFKSEQDLINRTPAFWSKFVQPKLETDFQRVYRYLARPVPDGRNEYIEAVERNINLIQRRAALMQAPDTDKALRIPETRQAEAADGVEAMPAEERAG